MSCGGQERARKREGATPFLPKKGERLLALLKAGGTLETARADFPELADDEYLLLAEIAKAHTPEAFAQQQTPEGE